MYLNAVTDKSLPEISRKFFTLYSIRVNTVGPRGKDVIHKGYISLSCLPQSPVQQCLLIGISQKREEYILSHRNGNHLYLYPSSIVRILFL